MLRKNRKPKRFCCNKRNFVWICKKKNKKVRLL
jgi:hypothetical protein